MEPFWYYFQTNYPPPALVVKPTFTPRVNIPAFFSLTAESSMAYEIDGTQSSYYSPGHNLTMRGMVVELKIDPGDGTPPFTCKTGMTRRRIPFTRSTRANTPTADPAPTSRTVCTR
jgi:hypothetical protein